jgi:hypothetical protein
MVMNKCDNQCIATTMQSYSRQDDNVAQMKIYVPVKHVQLNEQRQKRSDNRTSSRPSQNQQKKKQISQLLQNGPDSYNVAAVTRSNNRHKSNQNEHRNEQQVPKMTKVK